MHGDLGTSYAFQRPVGDLHRRRRSRNSLKLALLAFIIVVPLEHPRRRVRGAATSAAPIDRIITVGGLSATAVPEFVSGIVLILIFGALAERGCRSRRTLAAGDAASRRRSTTCSCRRSRWCCVLFGYIARMARAGTVEALDSDYTRTAVAEGPAAPHRDLAPRAAQRAAAHHHRDRHPDSAT